VADIKQLLDTPLGKTLAADFESALPVLSRIVVEESMQAAVSVIDSIYSSDPTPGLKELRIRSTPEEWARIELQLAANVGALQNARWNNEQELIAFGKAAAVTILLSVLA